MKNTCIQVTSALLLTISISALAQENSTESPIDCDIETNQTLDECVNLKEDGIVDEILVTGSYLKREKFTSPSPIEVFTVEDVAEAGVSTIGEYIRDASFTLNANTINQSGEGNGADTVLNLRGFGTDGTLTLVNGVRATTALDGNSLIPDIALERAEILLDGGGAIYGADAIAGVINLISAKKYEGVKFNTRYNSDLGGYDDTSFSILAGTSFDFLNLDIVQSFETQQRSTLSNTERPEYLRAAIEVSENGNPGVYERPGSIFNHPVFGPIQLPGETYVDPDCGSDIYNGSVQNDPGSTGFAANGIPVDDNGAFASTYADATGCRFAVGEHDDYLPALERYVSNTNFRFDLGEYVEINYNLAMSYRDVEGRGSYSIGESDELRLPGSHPALDTPVFASIPNSTFLQFDAWRPFGKATDNPSSYHNDGTFQRNDETRQYNHTVTVDYEIGSTSWAGQTYGSTSARTVARSQQVLRTSKMYAALQGFGGPNCGFSTDSLVGLDSDNASRQSLIDSAAQTAGQSGCEYFNPLLSSALDPSLSNSPELLDWLHDDIRWKDARTETRTWETRVVGELFDLPAGPLQLVAGFNFRQVIFSTLDSPIEAINDDFDGTGGGFLFDEQVRSPFAEVGIPILHNLNLSLAVRKEEYKDRNFGEISIPKYSISYQPFEDLAIRASYGESFTAPRGQQLDITDPLQVDFFVTQINDPFSVALGGSVPNPTGSYFFTGNADLQPETSETINIGFTYRGIENWEFSVDFQEIIYSNFISNLTITEQTGRQFNQFIAGGGDVTNASEVIDFLNSNPIDGTERNPLTGQINVSYNRPSNSPEPIVAQFADYKIRYNFDTNFGLFSTEWSGTTYNKYQYVPNDTLDGTYEDAVGQRNDVIGAAVALPRWKSDLILRWGFNDHSVYSRIKYIDGVQFDAQDIADGAVAPENIGSFTTMDLRYSYNFSDLFDGSARLTLGATNIFDRDAEVLPVRGGLDTTLQDPYGRRVYIEADYEF